MSFCYWGDEQRFSEMVAEAGLEAPASFLRLVLDQALAAEADRQASDCQ